MSDSLETLILDLLEWLDACPRPYSEVLDLWRTSCPRLPVWEDARIRGLVHIESAVGSEQLVTPSTVGLEHLRSHRRSVLQT